MPLDVYSKNPFSDPFPADLAKEFSLMSAEDIKKKSLTTKVKTLLTNPETRGKFLEWAIANPVILMNHPFASKVFKRIKKETKKETAIFSQSKTFIQTIKRIAQELKSDPQNEAFFTALKKWIKNPEDQKNDAAVMALLKNPKTKDEVLPILQSYLATGLLSFEHLFELLLTSVDPEDNTTLLQDEKIAKFLGTFIDKLDSQQFIEVLKMKTKAGDSMLKNSSSFQIFIIPIINKRSGTE